MFGYVGSKLDGEDPYQFGPTQSSGPTRRGSTISMKSFLGDEKTIEPGKAVPHHPGPFSTEKDTLLGTTSGDAPDKSVSARVKKTQ